MSIKQTCDAISEAIKAAREWHESEMRRLLDGGVDGREALRRVYSPHKTPAEHDAWCAEYDRVFGVKHG